METTLASSELQCSDTSVSRCCKPECDESHDRDSGIFLSDSDDTPALVTTSRTSQPPTEADSSSSSPSSFSPDPIHTPNPTARRSRAPTPPTSTESLRQRLRRPAALNLPSSATQPSEKPDRATLKSPTQLLRDRLNLSPKKTTKREAPVKIFIPPRPAKDHGCILARPGADIQPLRGSDITAVTESGGSKAWWCRVDRVVVFDGIDSSSLQQENEARCLSSRLRFRTRTNKGLAIATRRGDREILTIPFECQHCRDMLGREEWRYDVRVSRRSVCWDCRERCRWEWERERELERERHGDVRAECEGTDGIVNTTDGEEREGTRYRADSVLQSDDTEDQLVELERKIGIDGDISSPIEALGGIEERLEGTK